MINFNAPINSLSFGFVTVNILQELYNRGLTVNFFPIGETVDLGAYSFEQDFQLWLSSCLGRGRKTYKRTDPGLKLWHINGSEQTVSNDNVLFTFHETSEITSTEKNILQNQRAVLVSSQYTKGIMEEEGLTNVIYCPLGFDKLHFKKVNTQQPANIIQWWMGGKFELRKQTERIINLWCKKYGNRQGHNLNLSVYNPFLSPEVNNQYLMRAFGGQKPWNVNINGYTATLKEYNQCINACNIVLDMSRAEGFSLPAFNALALGKHGVIHNATAMKDWAGLGGATLVESAGVEPVYDDMFFKKGGEFSQGDSFVWKDEDFYAACEVAEAKVKANPVNEKGLELQNLFTWQKTTDIILEALK